MVTSARERHPLVARTIRAAKNAEEYKGRVHFRGADALDVRVSRGSFDRAMQLFEAIIVESEKQGYDWKISADGKTRVHCDDETFIFVLRENLLRRATPLPTPRSAGRRSRYEGPAELYRSRTELAPTGNLSFEVDEYLEGDVKRKWTDTPNIRLEDRLVQLVVGLRAVVAAVKLRRLAAELHAQASARAKATQIVEAGSFESRRLKRSDLITALTRWEQAERIRRFCDALEGRAVSRSEDVSTWLTWARQQAEILDPAADFPGFLAQLSPLTHREGDAAVGDGRPPGWVYRI